MNRLKYRQMIGVLLAIVMLTGCVSTKNSGPSLVGGGLSESQETESGQVGTGGDILNAGPGAYDSADTAVLVHKEEDGSSVTLQNLLLGKRYTLSVEGTSVFSDKYGDGVALSQIAEGTIVDVTFLKTYKRLTSMQVSSEAWIYEGVDKFKVDTRRQEISVGSKIYKYGQGIVLLSDEREIEMMDINDADILTIRGIESTVLSIQVVRGHGYLRLTNDENFIGGWIEIGQTLMQQITQDILLTVPEGVYQVLISNKGGGGEKTAVIRRNEETELDIGDLVIPEPQFGTVVFAVTPSDTEIFIDGVQTDITQPVSLSYGMHQIIARAEGYTSITKYLRVGEESAGIEIQLDPSTENEATTDNTESEESSQETESSEEQAASGSYQVYIDAPEGAEVYLDGNYVGISPCSFKKTSGSHMVTLRKNGYDTRTYTIQIDDEEKDISYSFADLIETAQTTVNTEESSSASQT
jgi:hypothetical protein